MRTTHAVGQGWLPRVKDPSNLEKKSLKNENIVGPALDNIVSFDQGLLFLPLPRLVRASIHWRNFWSSGRICQNQGKFYNIF